MKVRYIFDRVCLQIVHFSFLRTLTCFILKYTAIYNGKIAVHTLTQEYHRIPPYYPRIPSDDL